ncbi:hypothetical protein FB451DRAFT_1535512 [Mycena latifolia]|nr:hypothetical protein FB451DRAFT_1535512 [Mycena latifolia]
MFAVRTALSGILTLSLYLDTRRTFLSDLITTPGHRKARCSGEAVALGPEVQRMARAASSSASRQSESPGARSDVFYWVRARDGALCSQMVGRRDGFERGTAPRDAVAGKMGQARVRQVSEQTSGRRCGDAFRKRRVPRGYSRSRDERYPPNTYLRSMWICGRPARTLGYPVGLRCKRATHWSTEGETGALRPDGAPRQRCQRAAPNAPTRTPRDPGRGLCDKRAAHQSVDVEIRTSRVAHTTAGMSAHCAHGVWQHPRRAGQMTRDKRCGRTSRVRSARADSPDESSVRTHLRAHIDPGDGVTTALWRHRKSVRDPTGA